MNSDRAFEDSELNLKPEEQVLEISSTGYGLESVSKEESVKRNPSSKKNSGSCGGL